MSFLRHGQIYQSDVLFVSVRRRSRLRLRLRAHRLDEFAASYSLAGWSPPKPTSALPAGSIFTQSAETVNPYLRGGGKLFDRHNDYFSTGIDSIECLATSCKNQASYRGSDFPAVIIFSSSLLFQLSPTDLTVLSLAAFRSIHGRMTSSVASFKIAGSVIPALMRCK